MIWVILILLILFCAWPAGFIRAVVYTSIAVIGFLCWGPVGLLLGPTSWLAAVIGEYLDRKVSK